MPLVLHAQVTARDFRADLIGRVLCAVAQRKLCLGLCRLDGRFGELDLRHDDSWETPASSCRMEVMRTEPGSSLGKQRHMMDAPKLLIILPYRVSAWSSEVLGWSHGENRMSDLLLEQRCSIAL